MTYQPTYPIAPANADPAIIKPSPSFKKSVANVTVALIIFITIYLLILLSGIAVAIGSAAVGVVIIMGYPSFLTLILGAGLILSGAMLLFFLIKFIFKKQSIDYSGMVEVTADDQPQLFEFIKRLTDETGAPFPKHIFLTSSVNAGVFYNSTFWSMFVPVGKNLQIGLGLVNGLNMSEFKAVMAHEFGHFSQRSMTFGSYVYNLNKIVYNMLFDNEKYYDSLNKIARLHSFIRLGMMLNVYIVKGIQKLLRKTYVFLNTRHLVLSREMEFHADTIAAYYTGSNHAVNSLHRVEVSQLCYNDIFGFLNEMMKDDKRPVNIYPLHLTAIKFFAAAQHLDVDHSGIAIINKPLPALNNTQITVDDQWASHPSNNQREQHLKQFSLITPSDENSAWLLFNDVAGIQKKLSDIVYASTERPLETVQDEEVVKLFTDFNNRRSYNTAYKGFYDRRYITVFDVDDIARNGNLKYATADELLTDANCNIPLTIEGIAADLGTLALISTDEHTKNFNYEGVKYAKSDASKITSLLQDKLNWARQELEELDKQFFLFFYKNSADPESILFAYKSFLNNQKQVEQHFDLYTKMINDASPMYQTMKFDQIEHTVNKISGTEDNFKPALKQLLNNEVYQQFIQPAHRDYIEKYLDKKWIYFSRPVYNSQAIEVLQNALGAYKDIITEMYFLKKKELTELQLKTVA